MCTHQKFVYNRFTRTTFLAKCGKCPACLQEKAYKRASRIKSEFSPDKIALFVTLTYDRCSCPYVLQSDIDKRLDVLPVYREFTTRRVRASLPSGLAYVDKRKYHTVKIDEVCFPDYDSLFFRSRIPHLKFRSRNVGICYFPDIQLFKKRLNINLKRLYNYHESYKVYSAMEYGETTSRPHAHLLIFIRPCHEKTFRAAISQAWPYASRSRTERYIEIARDCANYVASYVNSGSHLHPFLSSNFKAKHSYSKDFGMSAKLFSLDSVLQKIERRDLSYLRAVGPKGNESYVNFSIPKYVINRYFPLFKGYSRFTDSEVLDVLRSFIQSDGRPKTPLISLDKLVDIDYTRDDLHKISVRLLNSYKNFCSHQGLGISESSKEDYLYYFYNAWKVYKQTNLKLWYLDNEIDPKYKYDNTIQLYFGEINSPETLDYLNKSDGLVYGHPNDYPNIRSVSAKYEQIYNFRCKERKVNNFVMAQNNYYF